MLPPPPESPPQRQMPTWAAFWLGGLLVMIGVGVGHLFWPLLNQAPIDAASTSRPTGANGYSGPAFDPTASAALVELAHAFSTSVAPTATPLPPTPTYAVATQIPPVICGPWVPFGARCEMPPAPLPTSTPISDCPVAPKLECVWRGTLGSPVAPTPAVNVGSPWAPS